ncbi:protein UPSTREAM OF FLC [Sesamum angolense]|uniref:Protein UPSTREAM OF FLC n=1 Tax=Sesamum angolense TaxID=2727404 RepID=A0AAE1WQM1_9LAMI|nr:protein UPSTREAM OF FLC [Sesamum angolense]
MYKADVKRWLGELRGKDMPESFAWSYKRRYKKGYVWQDLLDDDLITPISDNEYVLQGSEISSTHNTDFSYSEEKIPMQKEQSSVQGAPKTKQKPQPTEQNQSPSSSSSASETSILTDDSAKTDLQKNSDTFTLREANNKRRVGKVKNVLINQKINNAGTTSAASSTIVSDDRRTQSRSGASSNGNKLRSLISCGAVDTDDSALRIIMCSSDDRNVHNSAQICKREKKITFGTSYWTPNQGSNCRWSCDGVKDSATKMGQFKNQRGPNCPAAYKPIKGPNCSQCGKQFKPEKLHAHMKSCKGMKALSKNPAVSASAADETSKISTQSCNKDSVSAHFLSH